MASVDRRNEPPLGTGRAVLLAWIIVTSLLLIQIPDAAPYDRILGITALTIAAIGVLCYLNDRRRHPSGTAVVRIRTPRKGLPKPDPLAGLRRHSNTTAGLVQLALDLLDGPLRTQLDQTQISTASRAIRNSLAELATVDEAVDSARSALDELQRTLQRSDINQSSDADWRGLRGRLDQLEKRQAELVGDLDRAARNLRSAWEPVEQEMLRHLRAGELAKARYTAEAVVAAPDVSDVPDVTAPASARLSDAVDEIRARLGGVEAVDSINDRILGPRGTDRPVNLALPDEQGGRR